MSDRVAYFDCFSGASGDMILGALVDAGLPLADLEADLRRLPLAGYRLSFSRVRRAGIAAGRLAVEVDAEAPHPARGLAEVRRIIQAADLPPEDRERGEAVFARLAEAEARVHGTTPEAVRFHDVGAVDALVDVMGAVIGLRRLGVVEVYASPLPAGGGVARGPHGELPVPAPATLELLRLAGAPLRPDGGEAFELLTPTGAAILTTLARFGRPALRLEAVGYGAGGRDLPDRPNVLRLWLGRRTPEGPRAMVLVETNIDDLNPEVLGYVQERLLALGAADAWHTPVQMKKGRPATLVSVLCAAELEEAVVRLLLRETSTLGVRVTEVRRHEADREVVRFQSSLGPAAVKVRRLPGERPRVAPEYEDCRRLALETGRPLEEVYRVVAAEAEARLTGEA
ncbi:MAG TPA: nickel pincer cofactor biosynthesis protein LarC [Dehalococcoidia bacterium]